MTRSFDVFFDLRLNKRLSKQPWGWWFETPAWSLWRHRNGVKQLFQPGHECHGHVYIIYTSIILNDLTAHTDCMTVYWDIFTGQHYIWLDSNPLCVLQYCQYIPGNIDMVCTLLCFVVVWYGLIIPIFFRVASLALGQSYDCPSASEATLKSIGKYVIWIHHNWWYNHNKNRCIFYHNILSMPHVYQSKAVVT